ncbi:hypothetical protein LH53_05515 [Mesotoga sp. TolDC]|nr:hypothetical protein LH53_05515 [Mesotoga sp. TolDC]
MIKEVSQEVMLAPSRQEQSEELPTDLLYLSSHSKLYSSCRGERLFARRGEALSQTQSPLLLQTAAWIRNAEGCTLENEGSVGRAGQEIRVTRSGLERSG